MFSPAQNRVELSSPQLGDVFLVLHPKPLAKTSCFFEGWGEEGAIEIAPQVSNLLCSLPRSLRLLATLPSSSPWTLLPCSYITTAAGAWDVMSTTASTLWMGHIPSHPTRESIIHRFPRLVSIISCFSIPASLESWIPQP